MAFSRRSRMLLAEGGMTTAASVLGFLSRLSVAGGWVCSAACVKLLLVVGALTECGMVHMGVVVECV